ncbi:MAG: MerR family transcriptional regulator [Chloroflexota bacterium]
MERKYTISEFARLAGVTPRTLRHYEKLGVLQATQTSTGGHRLYAREDLLRLQQILTLQWMGYSLQAIGEMFNSTHFDLRRALQMQKEAVDAKIVQLKTASEALDKALGMTQSGEIDDQTLQRIIQSISKHDDILKLKDEFAATTWAGIHARQMQYTEADFAQFQQQWAELQASFANVQHLQPEHPDVQALAKTMHSYIEQFSAGDYATEQELSQVIAKRRADIAQQYESMPDASLHRFMQVALAIYRQQS